MNAMRCARRQAGFTLIEVLVAIALMAVVSIIAWRGLSNVSAMQQRLSGDAAEVEDLVRMLGQLERDVAQRAPDTIADTPVADGAVSPLPQSMRLTFPAGANGSAQLEIVRSDAAHPGAWQRVVWFVDDNVLRRATGLPSLQYPLPPAVGGAPVLTGVTRFAVRAWIPGQGWIPAPFPASSPAFAGLELSVERPTPAGVERYRRVVLLQ